MKLFPASCYQNISSWLDEEESPFWVCRYSALMGLESFLCQEEWKHLFQLIDDKLEDSHKFVRLKAENLQRKYSF